MSALLEDLVPGAVVGGVVPGKDVTAVALSWHGGAAVTLTYRDLDGRVGERLLYRPDEQALVLRGGGARWSFEADGELFTLLSEARRIRLAHLFDPLLAVHLSLVEPLPHQIRAVYGELLPRQPLRFVLADDPGAGKTIMAGLYIKELLLRADVARCLVVAPGGLVAQWQDELSEKFALDFEILTRDAIEASHTGNPLAERDLVIARLDHLARNEDIQARLEATEWDLVVVDEAHRMSAHYEGDEVRETRRYRLGRLLSSTTRHLLLLTATPVVNYDLPWNPNRIEQRFGRVHRIGQEHVCHMWNLVAANTREGQVYQLLLHKLDEQRQALGGQVFDVLGQAMSGRTLRDLLIEAIRYGERPEVRARLEEVIDSHVGEGIGELIAAEALASEVLSEADLTRLRLQMEEAAARRLQPHYVHAFFDKALAALGGRLVEREPERYEVTHVPAEVRSRTARSGRPVLRRYERICFDKTLVHGAGRPPAELPGRFADRPPVHPRDEDGRLAVESWRGAQGLAEDVRYYGAWMRDEAQRRIGHLYPPATLPDGCTATVIAWLWARTVTCPNPACRATMPLVRSFWLGKKKGKETWVRPVVEGRAVRFEIGYGRSGPPVEGTVGRTGATCLVCNTPVPLAHVRAEGKAGRMSTQLMAIVAEGDRQRIYLPPDLEHIKAADVPRPDDVPETELPEQALGFRVQSYGMTHHADLFTDRQLTALCSFSNLVGETRQRVIDDGSDPAYADAVVTYLTFLVGKVADRNSAICTWDSSPRKETPRSTFARQAVPMTWDFAEGNIFAEASGNFSDAIGFEAAAIDGLPAQPGSVTQADATGERLERSLLISTDPPYYDNVGYADLSDFFYVWLRRSLASVHPNLFSTVLTPKAAELVADPFRSDGEKVKADQRFEEGFERAFANMRKAVDPAYPLTVFYAFKQSEHNDDGVASTGWETMLTGLLHSGFAVTATWPMRTELGNRMRNQASNALASSIVLACRPRSESAGITDRRGFLAALHAELPKALRELQQGNIAPVDLAQAAIGPGMAVFSRYAKVVEPSGETMPVRNALTLINQVLDEVLVEQEGEFDGDTRFAIKWFEQYGFDEAGYDPAEGLARATNVSVKGLEDAGILVARAGRVRLLRRAELANGWDPTTDSRVAVWEVTRQLVKALWDDGSETAASDLLRRLGGLGEAARDLAYRLYSICERQGWAEDALGFNALVTSWPEILRRAASPDSIQPELAP